ncbi:3-phosphoserine/phosphohydroxythreonine transaminase [Acidobacteriota bacterium]
MAERKINFNPGPAVLPLKVLQRAKDELLDYKDTGMSILETSHRSKEFDEVLADAKGLFREIFNISDEYEILFLASGASMQFAMIPMNFLPEGKSADYIVTGTWSKKAIKEAKNIGKANAAANMEDVNFSRLPKPEEITLDPDAAYVHMTSNNTIFGTQWKTFPDTQGKPLICDMSSDIMSRKIDVNRFHLLYAGAQKNLGPSGTTVLFIRKDFAAQGSGNVPTMLSYKTHVDKNSLFNTPPVFPIYMVKLVAEWVKESGGLDAVQKWNEEKGKVLYDAIDGSDGYYKGAVTEKEDRSLMNVTMRLPSEDLEKEFIAEGGTRGFHGLKGHRSVGGIRVSMYNAISVDQIGQFADFMKEFKQKH